MRYKKPIFIFLFAFLFILMGCAPKEPSTTLPSSSVLESKSPAAEENKNELISRNLKLGRQDILEGRIDEGHKKIDEALKLNPNSARALLEKGSAFLAQKKLDKALDYYNKVVEADPKYFEGYIGRAEVYILRDRIDDALSEFKKSAECSPDSGDPLYGMARIYGIKKDYQKSADYYSKAIQKEPNKPIFKLYRSYAYIQLGDLKNARKDAEYVMKKNEKYVPNYQALLALAEVEEMEGNYEKAISIFNKALEMEKEVKVRFDHKHTENIHLSRGICYFDMKKYDLALKDFNTALNDKDNPKSFAYLQMALVYNKTGNRKKAIEMVKKWHNSDVHKRDLDHWSPYDLAADEGTGYAIVGEYNKAIEKLNFAVKGNPEFYFDRGSIYMKIGNYNAALADIESYLKKAPNPEYVNEAKRYIIEIRKKIGSK